MILYTKHCLSITSYFGYRHCWSCSRASCHLFSWTEYHLQHFNLCQPAMASRNSTCLQQANCRSLFNSLFVDLTSFDTGCRCQLPVPIVPSFVSGISTRNPNFSTRLYQVVPLRFSFCTNTVALYHMPNSPYTNKSH